jgi:hypothetical protein
MESIILKGVGKLISCIKCYAIVSIFEKQIDLYFDPVVLLCYGQFSYAKTINLSEDTEPDIFRAIHTDALLENVMIDPDSKVPDYSDTSMTENGRVS